MNDKKPFADTSGAKVALFRPETAQNGKRRIIGSMIALVIAMLIGFVVTFKALSSLVITNVEPDTNTAVKELDAGKFYVKFRGRNDVGQMYLEVDLSVKRSGPARAPEDPVVIRDRLIDLMVKSAGLPLVKTAQEPIGAMRAAMLAIAVVDAPWIANIKFRRGNVITRH
jgi:hypothetical protein